MNECDWEKRRLPHREELIRDSFSKLSSALTDAACFHGEQGVRHKRETEGPG